MMQQGLGALMPQQPAGQAPENPVRMAAAMDVVTSDAEEQVLDPRTLALIKYKDAVAAMQAADQLMAASQPTPTPPTVAERTKLAAQQGIMGLASRLAPGLQQQGSRMGAAQAQQAMTGGLAQLPAPNMAGMAGGGIVGYASGGDTNAAPTPTKVIPRPVPMGQPSVETQAAMSDDVARYIYNYTNLRASMEAATDPQQKAVINQRLQELQQTYSPDIVSEAHMKMSGQGMAGGGVVAFQAGGGVTDEQLAAIIAARPVKSPPQYPSQTERKAALQAEQAQRDAAREATREATNRRIVLANQGLTRSEIDTLLSMESRRNAVETSSPPLAQQPNIFNVGIDSPRAQQEFRMEGVRDATTPTAASTPSTNPTLDALRARVAGQGESNQNAQTAAPSASTNPALDDLLALIKSQSGEDAGAQYRELTGVDDLVAQRREEQQRLRALQEAQFSPEKERSRLLRAALAGGAESGLGGFGRGYTAEEGRITSEKQTSQQQVIADMNKTIADLRALGVGQFEAEQTAAEIHSDQLKQLAEMEQGRLLADRESRERGESENRADVRLLAELDQRRDIAELEAELRREGYTFEQSAAQAKAINDYAAQIQITPQELFRLATGIMNSGMPGAITFLEAVEQVRTELDNAPSVIQGVRQLP